MNAFLQLLSGNRNYRFTWIGQVVSEIGDHFNNIAVFSLAVAATRSGMVVIIPLRVSNLGSDPARHMRGQ